MMRHRLARAISSARVLSVIACGLGVAISSAKASTETSTILVLGCGLYRAHGRLEINAQDQFILRMRNGTVAPAELLLVDGNPAQQLSLSGLEVELEFFVPVAIRGNAGLNVVVVRSLERAKRLDDRSGPRLLRTQACDAEK